MQGDALWKRTAVFNGHGAQSDVMDLAWAPDGTALATGAQQGRALCMHTWYMLAALWLGLLVGWPRQRPGQGSMPSQAQSWLQCVRA